MDPYKYSWEDEDETISNSNPYDTAAKSFSDPSLLFQDSSFAGITPQSVQNYANWKMKDQIDPAAKFKQVVDPGFSSKRQPQTARAFREYNEWQNTGDFYKDQESQTSDIQKNYSKNRDTFYDKHVVGHYKDVFGVGPDDDNYDRVVGLIDKHWKVSL